jgi:hypothetical protein
VDVDVDVDVDVGKISCPLCFGQQQLYLDTHESTPTRQLYLDTMKSTPIRSSSRSAKLFPPRYSPMYRASSRDSSPCWSAWCACRFASMQRSRGRKTGWDPLALSCTCRPMIPSCECVS